MWWDILKNIQISGQKTSSRDYVNIDEEDRDCLKQLQKLVDALSKQPNLFSRSYYEDTYYNSNTLSIMGHTSNIHYDYVKPFEFSFYQPDKWTEEELCWAVEQLMNMPDFSDPLNRTIRRRKEFGDVYFDIIVDRFHDEGMLRPYKEGHDYVVASIDIGHRREQEMQFTVAILAHKYKEIVDFIRRGLS